MQAAYRQYNPSAYISDVLYNTEPAMQTAGFSKYKYVIPAARRSTSV